MKQLIISIYDSFCTFTYLIIEDGKEIEKSNDYLDLKKYDLLDEEWSWFDEKLINENNEKIKQFDLIIVCEDGEIRIFNNDQEAYNMLAIESMKELLNKKKEETKQEAKQEQPIQNKIVLGTRICDNCGNEYIVETITENYLKAKLADSWGTSTFYWNDFGKKWWLKGDCSK